MEDVKNMDTSSGVDNPQTSSAGTQNTDATAGAQGQHDAGKVSDAVPYSRFKEVIDEKNEALSELTNLASAERVWAKPIGPYPSVVQVDHV